MKLYLRAGDRPRKLVAPSRGRGLKQVLSLWAGILWSCRPFTGAWIETGNDHQPFEVVHVAPSRGRGLKLTGLAEQGMIQESPLHGGVD